MEVALGVFGALLVVGAVLYIAKLKGERDRAVNANKSLPLYREAIKRQNREITNIHKAIVSSASADELADILNRVYEDDHSE